MGIHPSIMFSKNTPSFLVLVLLACLASVTEGTLRGTVQTDIVDNHRWMKEEKEQSPLKHDGKGHQWMEEEKEQSPLKHDRKGNRSRISNILRSVIEMRLDSF